jgi:hypothetical protein
MVRLISSGVNWLQRITEHSGTQSVANRRSIRSIFPQLLIPQLLIPQLLIPLMPHQWAHKAFTFSSVCWLEAVYNVTDDTAR